MSYSFKSQHTNEELAGLYQETILDHFKRPRHKKKADHCGFCQEGKNPLCGDTIVVYCELNERNGQKFINTFFEGSGCSISQASASIMCDLIHNVTIAEAKNIIQQAEQTYTGKITIDADNMESDLDALYGVSQFPVRIKCAALAWKTLGVLLADNFDANGHLIEKPCVPGNTCQQNKTKKNKLKIVNTEN